MQKSGLEYFITCITQKYAVFEGRSRRREFWYTTLFISLISFPFNVMEDNGFAFKVLSLVVSLIFFLPSLSVAVRRLHDTGRSGKWLLLMFTIIGIPVVLYFYIQDSQPGYNEYGPNPKSEGNDQENILDQLV
ncbi:MAG: DUF805 domain-containing protein [Saprospiraceae bacterium]|nr:DUF805 domain-containing protein [Saprospiraceae bacterium]